MIKTEPGLSDSRNEDITENGCDEIMDETDAVTELEDKDELESDSESW